MMNQLPEKDVRTLDAAQKTLALLEECHRVWDLPMPWDITITHDNIALAFEHLADVAEWAKHLDTVIEEHHDHGVGESGVHHYSVNGVTQGVDIHLWVAANAEDAQEWLRS